MRTISAGLKWMGALPLRGVLFLAATHTAQAQVSFGFGVSHYGAPAYGAGYGDVYGYRELGRERWLAQERREEWEAVRAAEWRREQWEQQRFYGHDQGAWRGRDDHWQRDRY